MKPVLLIDFGSTYTKVTAADVDEGRLLGTANAYTTVQSDINNGLSDALSKLEKVTGKLDFCERYAASSAAGGLRMLASGLVPELTAEAAKCASLGAGAKVLGPFRVGDNARVAAGAVVLDAVPDNATAVGVPARIVRVGGKRVMDNSTLDQIHVADPVAQEMCRMRLEIEHLHGELNSCRREKSKLTAQKAEKNKEEKEE